MFKAFVIVSISCSPLKCGAIQKIGRSIREEKTGDGSNGGYWLFKRDVSHPLTGCQVSRAASTAKQRNCFDESGRTLDAATHDGLCAQTKN